MLIDFHSLISEAQVSSRKSGFRFRQAGRNFSIRLLTDCDPGVSRFLVKSLPLPKKISRAGPQ
jgi:hypothetical protein